MSITIVAEDGSGLADSNSYVTAVEALTYWSNRLNTSWAAASADTQASALIVATQYLDARYTYKGVPLTTTQALLWPRQAQSVDYYTPLGIEVSIYDTPTTDSLYTWPVQRLKDATYEVALRALSGALYTDQDSKIITSEKVGSLQINYSPNSRNGGQARIAIVDDILAPLLAAGRYSFQVTRA